MESKPPDLGPDNLVSVKRGRFDTTNSPTMVYVRRKIDHDQQNKPSPSCETLKNGGGESAKEPNLGINEETKEPDLECHEPNMEAELYELKGLTPNVVENKENGLILDPNGNQIESQLGSESELHELEVVAPNEDTHGDKESNLSPNGERNEPDLVCHETNLDSDLVELKVAASNQLTSLGVNEKEIEPQLGADLQQQTTVFPNKVTNGDKDQNLTKNGHKLGSITPKQVMTDSNYRPCERENYRERFTKLQVYLKDCDRSRQDDYLRSKNFYFHSSEFSLRRCPLKYRNLIALQDFSRCQLMQ